MSRHPRFTKGSQPSPEAKSDGQKEAARRRRRDDFRSMLGEECLAAYERAVQLYAAENGTRDAVYFFHDLIPRKFAEAYTAGRNAARTSQARRAPDKPTPRTPEERSIANKNMKADARANAIHTGEWTIYVKDKETGDQRLYTYPCFWIEVDPATTPYKKVCFPRTAGLKPSERFMPAGPCCVVWSAKENTAI